MSLSIGKTMAVITKNYYGALSKRIEHLGIDRNFNILILIDTAKEKCTQQYLSDMLDCNKVLMVKKLDYLVEKKMITREMNADDRRERIINLTVKGKRIVPQIQKEIAEMNNIALKGFTKKDLDLFKNFLNTTERNLKNLPVNTVDIKIKN
jgi:DNA-binding MarR family transcriptional regulator